MWVKLIALMGAVFPLPNITDAKDLEAWLDRIKVSLSEFVSALALQIKTTGRALIELPTGKVITLEKDASGKYAMSDVDRDDLCLALADHSELPRKFGDGKFLELITSALNQLLPIFLQVLPYLLKKEEEKKQEETPTPPVV
jgi:hypothetical protein